MEAREFVSELRKQCVQRPSSFAMFDKLDREWFCEGGWGFTPIGTHRDADTLTRSNWEVIKDDLLERFPDAFIVFHTSHCLVGWYDHLAVDTSNDAAMEALAEWTRALESYPVASDEHWSELEWNEACEYWERASVRDRAELIKSSGARCSIFAARRAELPEDDSGSLMQHINQ